MNLRFAIALAVSAAASICAGTARAQYLEAESFYPADGSTLHYTLGQSLETVNITFPSDIELAPGAEPWLESAVGARTECTRLTTGAQLGMGNTVIMRFDGASSLGSGSYVLHVPQGMAGTPAWAAGGYGDGDCNPAYELTYIYEGNPDAPDDPVDDGTPLELTMAQLRTGHGTYDLLKEGLALPGLSGESQFIFDSNKNGVAEAVFFSIYNLTAGEEVRTYWTYDIQETADTKVTVYGKNAQGQFVVDTTYGEEFYSDCDYEMTVGFYRRYDSVPEAERVCYGTAVIPFRGTTAPYAYSGAEILSVTPSPSEGIPSADTPVEIEFSEPVVLDTYRSGIWAPDGDSMTLYLFRNPYPEDGGCRWVLPLNAMAFGQIEGQLVLRLAATDSFGRPVSAPDTDWSYNMGSKEGRIMVIEFNTATGLTPACTDPGAVRLYAPDGRRLQALPAPGTLYIEVTPQGARKTVAR